jgi:hypothetical protein
MSGGGSPDVRPGAAARVAAGSEWRMGERGAKPAASEMQSGSPANRAPARSHINRQMITAIARRQAATSTMMVIRMVSCCFRMLNPPGRQRAVTLKVTEQLPSNE